jgi:hypothetical protein
MHQLPITEQVEGECAPQRKEIHGCAPINRRVSAIVAGFCQKLAEWSHSLNVNEASLFKFVSPYLGSAF